MKNKLSYKEMKKIVREIYEEEKEKYDLDVNVCPITIIEYYSSDIFTKTLKITKDPLITATIPFFAGGYNDTSKENIIVVFLSHIKKIKKLEKKIFTLAEFCYHELRHQEQKQFDKFSYEGFFGNIDAVLAWDSTLDYLIEHSKYSFEIGAYRYSIQKAKEYLKKNYPELYEQEKEYIEEYEKKYDFYYKTYDAAETIDRLIKALHRKKKYIEKNQGTEKTENYEKNVLPILMIFFNDDLTPKKISDIINNQEFNKLDRKIIYAFLSSKTFLENICYEELNEEELILLEEALKYTNTIYQEQMKLLSQETNITLIEMLKVEKNVLQKYTRLEAYLTNKIKHALNFKRNDSQKKEHMKTIHSYLEKTNQLIEKRTSRGYITINIFYIISLLLSISTIIYLLIKK